MKALVTGATGFVAAGIIKRLISEGVEVTASQRDESPIDPLLSGIETRGGLRLAYDTDWSDALDGVEVVVHTAGRAHIMRDIAIDPLMEYRRINVEGTMRLAQQALEIGVKRFIFISTVKVNGESTVAGMPFHANDVPMPIDPYAISKFEAEESLLELGGRGNMDIVIIRPSLVYGPGVKANFLAMMKWLEMDLPLPLKNIDNQRSMVALDNLADLVYECLKNPRAANEIFLASDGCDLSTPELLRKLGKALSHPARLYSAPVWLLQLGAAVLGKKKDIERLLGSLQVDISKNRELLGWTPKTSIEMALEEAAVDYRERYNR